MKTYLAVPFGEKDEAKKLGAWWDPICKKWYAPNGEAVLLERWKVNDDVITLVGEDRDYGGSKLFVDLIPRSCWFTNVRYCVHASDWDRLRAYVYGRVHYRCECCNIDTRNPNAPRLEAHERWDYNEETATQKLVRLVALCHECHQSTHMGLANVRGKGREARLHLEKVMGFTEEESARHIEGAFKLWRKRNLTEWRLDLSLITSNNIRLARSIDREVRSLVSKSRGAYAYG